MRDPETEPTIRSLPLAARSATILPGDYVTRADAARMLGVTVTTMWLWDRRGIGPTCTLAAPRLCIYPLAEVQAEIERRGTAKRRRVA